MSDEEDVPPLEDMSELLQHTEAIRQQLAQGNSQSDDSTAISTSQSAKSTTNTASQSADSIPISSQSAKSDAASNSSTQSKPSQQKQPSQQKTETFGGFKKGFLLGGATSTKQSKPAPQKSKDTEKTGQNKEDVPLITANQSDKQSQWQMPEVQQAMKVNQSLLQQDTSWLTKDLLCRVQSSGTLLRGMSDPRYQQALTEFQTNPQAAMVKYQDNTEIQDFLKEFSQLMGEHFTRLADKDQPKQIPKPPAPTAQTPTRQTADISARSTKQLNPSGPRDENSRVQQILNDPQLTQILIDPEIQTLMQNLRSDPDKAQRMLRGSDPGLQVKVKKLVDAGLLQIRR